MGELTARLWAALDMIRRPRWRRRVELEGVDPYTWRRIVRRARIGSTATLVAAMYADYANPDGTNVRPGIDRLVNVSELSKSSVIRATVKLRSLGLLDRVVEGSAFGRAKLKDEYRLTIPRDAVERIPMLGPDEGINRSGVTVTPDSPVDNPGTGVTETPDPPPEPVDNPNLLAGNQVSPETEQVSLVLGTGVPVTPHLNKYLPSTPNQDRLSGGRLADVEGPPILVSAAERNDLESGDEKQRYAKAVSILSRLPDLGAQFMEKATAELPEARTVERVIRAAQICVTGISA